MADLEKDTHCRPRAVFQYRHAKRSSVYL